VFHLILYQPEIPPNTGNIIRLCANTGCRLHLIEPLGFGLDDSSVRRAGLDYSDMAIVRSHPCIADCLAQLPDARLFAVETGAGCCYTEPAYRPGDALLFGPWPGNSRPAGGPGGHGAPAAAHQYSDA
jgi:tRNA (cytidine/uridine-2'-O-)-methyltransferase